MVQSEEPLPLGMTPPEKKNFIFDVNQANKIVNYTPSDAFQLSSKDIEFGTLAVNKYQQYASEFDSVIGNNFLLNVIESFNYVYLMLIAFILAPLFSLEKYHEMEGLQISSKKGRRTLVFSKFLVGFSISTGLFFVNLLNITIQSFIYFPVRNLKLLVQSQVGLGVGEVGTGKYAASFLTYGEVLWQCLLGAFVAFLGIAFITMFISYLTKNQMITFGILSLLI